MAINNATNHQVTQYNVITGGASNILNNVAPSATSGVPVISQGASSQPIFGTAVVAGGGTGNTTLTNHSVLVGATLAAITQLSVGATGTLLVGATAADPAFAASATGDFTFTSTTAGGTRVFTVSNTDNTNAASTSNIKSLTGGASSGDATFQASTTTTTWTFGVDNSITTPTADTFVISQGTALGTNNIMSVATSGEINYPLQPAFLAYLNTQDTDVTGNGATYTLGAGTNLLTEVFDQNSDFNTNGTFTAPVTGRYYLQYNQGFGGVTAAMTSAVYKIVTSNNTFTFSNISAGVVMTSGNLYITNGSVLCDMDASDTATFISILGNGAGNTADSLAPSTGNRTFVSGFLMC